MSVYVVMPPSVLLDVLREHAPLVESFAAGFPRVVFETVSGYGKASEERDQAGLVLTDALLERASWAHPKDWKKGLKERDRLGMSLFWIGFGQIRQSIMRQGGKQGWRELDATKKVRRKSGVLLWRELESLAEDKGDSHTTHGEGQ